MVPLFYVYICIFESYPLKMDKTKYKTTGYSGKLLPEKLGFKKESRILFQSPPENIFTLIPTNNYHVSYRITGEFDIILFFSKSFDSLKKQFPLLKTHLLQNGSLWTCWAKKTSKQHSDLK
jgi:hypothetical protein